MGSPDETSAAKRDEIRSSLDSLIEISEKWVKRLQKREAQVRLASAFLTFLLVFFIIAAITVGFILETYSFVFFEEHGRIIFALLLIDLIVAIVAGSASYIFWGRKWRSSLQELSNLISEIKREDQAGGYSFNALALAEKVISLLPEVVRRRNQDSFLFGVVAFVLSVIVVRSPEIALIIGVVVWLYFRYEMNKDYDKEISRFEEQKRLFEQRKKEFLETL